MLENLKEYQFNFKKQYGQHFLTDTNLLRSIVAAAGINQDSNVLEIGAGAGTLTKILAESAKQVVSYEIDFSLEPVLAENLKAYDNVKVVFRDFMKEEMKKIESRIDGAYTVVANIPYYITTPIIFKLLEHATKLSSLVLTVQKEVAERFTSQPGSKQYGAVTAVLAFNGNTKIIKIVKKHMFMPPPKVDSCVIKIDIVKDKFTVKDKKTLSGCIRAAFENRRKVYMSNLKHAFKLSTEQLEEIFNKLGHDTKVRGETFSIEEFVALAYEIYERKK